jgi:hypothetical protein
MQYIQPSEDYNFILQERKPIPEIYLTPDVPNVLFVGDPWEYKELRIVPSST